MLSGVTNCSSGAQSCLPVSTLQRHLKCFQLSTWFGKLWGSLWDLGSGFLGMLLKPARGREPTRTGSADHISVLWGEGPSGSRGSGGVCLAVGCPCDCEGMLSAEVLSLSSLVKRYWVLLSTAESLAGPCGSFGWSQMLCCV